MLHWLGVLRRFFLVHEIEHISFVHLVQEVDIFVAVRCKSCIVIASLCLLVMRNDKKLPYHSVFISATDISYFSKKTSISLLSRISITSVNLPVCISLNPATFSPVQMLLLITDFDFLYHKFLSVSSYGTYLYPPEISVLLYNLPHILLHQSLDINFYIIQSKQKKESIEKIQCFQCFQRW